MGHQCLQALLGCWIKAVHALRQLQLCFDRLNVCLNPHGIRDGSRVAKFRKRTSQYDHYNAHHQHDLEQREALLFSFDSHLDNGVTPPILCALTLPRSVTISSARCAIDNPTCPRCTLAESAWLELPRLRFQRHWQRIRRSCLPLSW